MIEEESAVDEYENTENFLASKTWQNVVKTLFGKFFKKYGLMEGKFKQQFDSISNVIIGK